MGRHHPASAAGWRCEHCRRHLPPGGRGDHVLTVHHLDGDVSNLMSWDLVALCIRCHGWAAREVTLDEPDVEQLSLAPADPRAWLS